MTIFDASFYHCFVANGSIQTMGIDIFFSIISATANLYWLKLYTTLNLYVNYLRKLPHHYHAKLHVGLLVAVCLTYVICWVCFLMFWICFGRWMSSFHSNGMRTVQCLSSLTMR